MGRGIHFSKEEIDHSLQKLYEISEDMEACRKTWRSVCHDSLSDLPDDVQSGIENLGTEIGRIRDQVRDQADMLKKVSSIYENVESRNRRLIRQLDKRLEGAGERNSSSPVSDLLRRWNGRVKRKISINRKIIMEDWLQAYLLHREIR